MNKIKRFIKAYSLPFHMVNVTLKLPQNVAAKVTPQELAAYAKGLYEQRTSPFMGEIDLQSADGGKRHTQNQWINLYNAQQGEFLGKRIITAPDAYRAGKSSSPQLLESMQRDFDISWMTTGTKILYDPKTLDGRVVHPRGIGIEPIKRKLLIPVYQDASLDDVLGTGNGVNYMRAVLHTTDEKLIAQTLSTLSNKEVRNIYVWTPTQENRAGRFERAVDFVSIGEWFDVDGYYWPGGGGDGHSRGVSVKSESAKPTRQNK